MRNKLLLTHKFVNELPAEHAITEDKAKATWWYNIRQTGGMRLTPIGFKALSEHLHLPSYPYKLTDPTLFNQKTVLKLDRLLQHPYYIVIEKKIPVSLLFFSSQEAMLVNLYGSLNKFIDNYHK